MRSLFLLALGIALISPQLAHAQSSMCEPLNRIIASSHAGFGDMQGEPVVVDGHTLRLYHALVSLPDAQECVVFSAGYQCTYRTTVGNEVALTDLLLQQASACANPQPAAERREQGWQFQFGTTQVNINRTAYRRGEVLFQVSAASPQSN